MFPVTSLHTLQQHRFCLEHACTARPPPTTLHSVPMQGRLWGFEGGASCAFRNEEGSPVFYIDYEPGNWVLTPPCATEPFHSSAMMVCGVQGVGHRCPACMQGGVVHRSC